MIDELDILIRREILENMPKAQPQEDQTWDTIMQWNDSGCDNGKNKEEDVDNNDVSERPAALTCLREAVHHPYNYSLVTIRKDKRTFV